MKGTIGEFRKLRGLTRERLAIDIGVTVSSIADWEQGKSIPSVLNARKAAERLGISEADIEWGKPTPK